MTFTLFSAFTTSTATKRNEPDPHLLDYIFATDVLIEQIKADIRDGEKEAIKQLASRRDR